MWLAICTWLNSFHTREPPNFWKPQKGGLNTLKYLVFINSFPFASVLLLTGVPQLYYEWVIFIYVSILSIITICIKICSESQNARCTEPACYNGYLQSYNYNMYCCVTKEGKTLISLYLCTMYIPYIYLYTRFPFGPELLSFVIHNYLQAISILSEDWWSSTMKQLVIK